MRALFLTLLLVATLIGNTFAQPGYMMQMGKAMRLWGDNKQTEAVARFERVASVNPKKWLPDYYIALICAIDVLNKRDPQNNQALLKKANQALEKAMTKSTDNAELYCLKGLIYTAQITLDPINNGQKLSPLVIQNYQKAITLDNNNPRAIYLLAEYQLSMAKMFGGNTDNYYKQLELAIKKFDTFKAPSSFHPKWGKERAQQLLKQRKI